MKNKNKTFWLLTYGHYLNILVLIPRIPMDECFISLNFSSFVTSYYELT